MTNLTVPLGLLVHEIHRYISQTHELASLPVEIPIKRSTQKNRNFVTNTKLHGFGHIDLKEALLQILNSLREKKPNITLELDCKNSSIIENHTTSRFIKTHEKIEFLSIKDYPFSSVVAQFPKPKVYNPGESEINMTKILSVISKAQYDFMKEQSIEQLLQGLLKGLLEATDSQLGFIGKICKDENTKQKYLKTYAYSDISWSEETKHLYTNLKNGLEFRRLDSLIGYSIETSNFCISNDPLNDPRSSGVPYGHPPVKYYLGCPICKPKDSNIKEKFIGLIGIANREGGYNLNIINSIIPLLYNCSGIIGRFEAKEKAKLLQNKLIQSGKDFELKIEERTNQLEEKNTILTKKIEEGEEIVTALGKAMDFKNEYFSTVSHELRSPIQAIVGITELLVETKLTNIQQKYLNIIKQNGETMSQLVNDILDVGKIEAGKIQFVNSYFSIIKCLNDVSSTYSLGAYSKGIDFGCKFDKQLLDIDVFCDSGRIKQIIVNLVSNAIKFTSTGHVKIITKLIDKKSDLITFSIQINDSGVGLSESQIARLFQIFYQGNSDKFNGTGIGLFLSRKLVESLNGEINVTSKLGVGSTFSVLLSLPYRTNPKLLSLIPHFNLLPNIHKENIKIGVLDPCNFTRKSLCKIISYITDLKLNENIISFDDSSISDIFHDLNPASIINSFDDYSLIFIDSFYKNNFPSHFSFSSEQLEKLKCKIVFLTKISSTSDAKEITEFVHIFRPVVVCELLPVFANCFSFNIEIPPDNENLDVQADDVVITKKFKSGDSMLIVDDSKSNRMYFKKIATSLKLKVFTAESGLEALELQKNHKFDVVLMDMCMSPMDGLTCTRLWREYETNNNLPSALILASTGNSSDEDIQKCMDAGMDHHLCKPINQPKLMKFMETD